MRHPKNRPQLNALSEYDPPLKGVRVLDFTHVVAGPYCTMMLADMGADIVKVERPQGDEIRRLRKFQGRRPQDEDYFYSMNRSKRSIVLDLKLERDRGIARDLAAHADVVVQNFAPGTAERLGIGPVDLCEANPKLIYCALSGYGQTGPLRDQPAVDPIVQARSGVMSVTGEPNGPPMRTGAPIGDVTAGMFAAYGIVNALFRVKRGGPGCVIDVSLLESLIAVLGPRMSETLMAHRNPDRVGNANVLRVPSGMFSASDGQRIVFELMGDAHWALFCSAIAREELVDDPRFSTAHARVQNRADLDTLITEALAQRPASEWIERFTQRHLPVAPVYDYLQALNDPQIVARELIVSVEHPESGKLHLVGSPLKGTLPSRPAARPPLLGEHTESVLEEWLGISKTEV